ncbi:CsgG/HfaB family protein [Candidatus Marinimicrobia bacterium]|nr:CsgG/HfaB family protein [Candidatus Neomarinimicrobiota bacterium]
MNSCYLIEDNKNSRKIKDKNKYNLNVKLNNITDSIINEIDENSIKKIAIMDFSTTNSLGKNTASYITNELTFNLFLKNKFIIVERDELSYVIDEQRLNSSGLIESSINKIGNISSVDAVVVGEIIKKPSENFLTVKILSVETGEILFIEKISFLDFLDENHFTQNTNEKVSKLNGTKNHNQIYIDSKKFKKLTKEILNHIANKDLKNLNGMMATKYEYEKYLIIKHKADSKKKRQIKKNIRSSYSSYKQSYRKNIGLILKQIKKNNLDVQNLKIKRINPKINSQLNRKKIYRVDVTLTTASDKIKLNYNALSINGKWIIDNLFIKKLK